jgi:membrane associated rhomboid family serine protease
VSQADTWQMGGLPRPGRVLKVVMIAVLAIWLAFAIGINWAGAPETVFLLFCGNTERILSGEVFRLFTAPWMHMPSGTIGHVLSTLFGLYFLAPSLEEKWGGKRFAWFLFLSGLIAYGLQVLVQLVLPSSVGVRLVPEYWFGGMPVIGAISIAWAMSFRGQTVRLFFVLPVSSRGLLLFVVGANVMYLIALAQSESGLIAPFGGMLAGYLLGGSTPSPLRRAILKFRLSRLDAEAAREAEIRRKRIRRSGLQVLPGGRKGVDDDDDGDGSGNGDGRGPNGRWLN